MKHQILRNTPIKEIVFLVTYDEVLDADCFDKFLNLEIVNQKFSGGINPSINQKINIDSNGEMSISSNSNNGFHLKTEDEVIQVRKDSFSFHYINKYKEFSDLLNSFLEYWALFDSVTQDKLTITDYSLRYINLIEIDENEQPSRLVQLYPKYSSDRNIKGFQNSVQFSYTDKPDYNLNIVSTKIKEKNILLDITASGRINSSNEQKDIKELLSPLRDIKNRAFYDSITAQALLKYLD